MAKTFASYIVAILFQIAHPVSAQSPTVQEVETKAVQTRKAIRNGYLSMKGEETWTNKGNATKYGVERQIWFTNDRIRVDISRTNLSANEKPIKSVECKNYDGLNTYFGRSDVDKTIGVFGKSSEQVPTSNLFDPRVLGFCGHNLFNTRMNARYDRFLGSQYRKDVHLQQVELNGLATILLSWEWKSDTATSVKVWISPTQDHNIVKISTSNAFDKYNLKSETNIKLKLYPNGVWFPEKYTSDSDNNETIHVRDEFTVIDAWFNRADPLEQFTFDSLGVKAGDRLMDSDKGQVVIWTGDKIKTYDMEDAIGKYVDPQPVNPVPGRTNYWMVAACIALASFAVFLLSRFVRSRR